jgi:glycosyltransferase involved in cell wall biosynthesis
MGSSNRVPELLQAMDVFVLPSLAEGICNALLEAMASGLPVVATAVGGNPEVVVDGESGLLFPVGDSRALATHLSEIRTQRGLGLQLGQRAVQCVREKFSVDSMVQKYAELYRSVGPAVSAPASAIASV